jgi:lysozyme
VANVRGIDLSNNNGYAAVDKLPRSVDFVYAKCTEGLSFVDPDYLHICGRCASTKRRVGGYHFAHPINGGEKEAWFFLSHLAICSGDLIPALDVERNEGHVREYCVDFSQTIYKALGCDTLLYVSNSFCASYVGSQIPHMQLWLAEWDTAYPDLPGGWQKWALWQYKVGRLTGVGAVDLDIAKMPYLVWRPKPVTPPKKKHLSTAQRIAAWAREAMKWKRLALRYEAKLKKAGIRP